jgi:hypothetical protein
MIAPDICSRCVLPAQFPNISFDAEGVCNYCRQVAAPYQAEFDDRQRREFQEIVQQTRGKQPYDALCCYSGGKDSTYMLQQMVHEHQLQVLAFTLDNGFITADAKDNILKIVEVLGVDHVFFKPSARWMKRSYRQAILGDLNAPRGNYSTRISDVCLSCISLVNAQAARLAIQQRIPLIFAGFTPGQIPRAVIKDPHHFYQQTFQQHRDHWHAELGDDAARYLDVADAEFTLYQLSPYLVFEVSERDILHEIRQLGWQNPRHLDGCSSNCALNAVGNLCHVKKFGFHPYVLELSKLIRKGLLSRENAIAKLETQVDPAIVSETMIQIDLDEEDLNRLRRAA